MMQALLQKLRDNGKKNNQKKQQPNQTNKMKQINR